MRGSWSNGRMPPGRGRDDLEEPGEHDCSSESNDALCWGVGDSSSGGEDKLTGGPLGNTEESLTLSEPCRLR